MRVPAKLYVLFKVDLKLTFKAQFYAKDINYTYGPAQEFRCCKQEKRSC